MIAYLTVRDARIAATVGERLQFLLLRYTARLISTAIKAWVRNPRLREFVDVGDSETMQANTRDIPADLDPYFLEVDWKSASYDMRPGRDLVIADLETMSANLDNGDDGFEDLKMVDGGSILADGDTALAPRVPALANRTEGG